VVQDSGKALRANTLRPVNLPESLKVDENSSGLPVAIRMPGKQVVISIDDRWLIDDEWWRSEPLSRFYYAIRFASGQCLVVYKDLIKGKWYKQGY
jgi:hypothetical protein